MAVEKLPISGRLSVLVQTGVDEHGDPISKSRSFSNVKPTAPAADVYAVAQGLLSLQVYPEMAVTFTEQSQLMEN